MKVKSVSVVPGFGVQIVTPIDTVNHPNPATIEPGHSLWEFAQRVAERDFLVADQRMRDVELSRVDVRPTEVQWSFRIKEQMP